MYKFVVHQWDFIWLFIWLFIWHHEQSSNLHVAKYCTFDVKQWLFNLCVQNYSSGDVINSQINTMYLTQHSPFDIRENNKQFSKTLLNWRLTIIKQSMCSKIVIIWQFPYQIMFLLIKGNIPVSLGEKKLPNPPEHLSSPLFLVRLVSSICSFLCSVLWRIVCLFVLVLLAIVLSVNRIMSSDYPIGIFKLFLYPAAEKLSYFYISRITCNLTPTTTSSS